MNGINQAELVDFVRNRAVTRFRIIQNAANNYQIVINLTWKEGDLNLVTARGKPREWASLHRLARHIQEEYLGHLPPIDLTLNTASFNKRRST
jgi:hypothetical protein